jgi:hypothetical protein
MPRTWESVSAGSTLDPAWGAQVISAIDTLEASVGSPAVDTDTTSGTTGTACTIADQGSTDYIVVVTFQTATPGDIGEWSVVNDSGTQFTLYNTGEAGITFSYKVFL